MPSRLAIRSLEGLPERRVPQLFSTSPARDRKPTPLYWKLRARIDTIAPRAIEATLRATWVYGSPSQPQGADRSCAIALAAR